MSEYKNSKVICIKSGTSMQDARELMAVKRIRHLPIIDSNNNIISMLSKHDLTDVIKFQQLPVDSFASSPVQYVDESTPLSVVALRMVESKISSVLISNEKKEVVGIITSDDLLYKLSQILKIEENKKENSEYNYNFLITTAGDFFKKLSDVGI
jgi:acetoin utilization protein AcuB